MVVDGPTRTCSLAVDTGADRMIPRRKQSVFSISAFLVLVLFLHVEQSCSVPVTVLGVGIGCQMLNNCNGHGTCSTGTKSCVCLRGWGAPSDVAYYKAPDCSQRTCPAGKAWVDLAQGNAAHKKAECSNAGLCDRTTGICKCFGGFEGSACQRRSCQCSGHGVCMSMRQLAKLPNSFPLSAPTTYEGDQLFTTWDQDSIFGCLCDSSWPVGLGSGEVQEAEYFGADCRLKHCPSGDDPMTSQDETDCNGVTARGGKGVGTAGNLCHVDCSNRGNCDYSTGTCHCYSGYYGANCGTQNPYAVFLKEE